jgi:uncharacterized SAM-binding protein YcdF (DUF218 family)
MKKIKGLFLSIKKSDIHNLIKKLPYLILGIASILYFITVTLFNGYINPFNLLWVFLGLFFISFGLFGKIIRNTFKKMPKWIKIPAIIFLCVFFISFLIVSGLIISNIQDNHTVYADYAIVLGAKVDGNIPSLSLRGRITTAIKYLKENDNTKIIVTGGQGNGEYISEAEAIARELKNNNISMDRILVENQSRSTRENLQYSTKFINSFDDNIVIITSEFHLYRAKAIAKKIGYKNIRGIPSKSPGILFLSYFVREYFAIVHNKLTNKFLNRQGMHFSIWIFKVLG